ncbi:hypothetical protein C4D60_Mb04t11310 [Musa balbisiana]|uniref:Uncharacterized protein n=1 Tax=Musa balbisiana TaxID=52838 RepID=A0A4S8KBA6_MUSBA|nr:hypothetical protein C4D60_Mb04t11310 [Musa balbisiana]
MKSIYRPQEDSNLGSKFKFFWVSRCWRCHRLSVSDTDSVLAVPPPELSGSGRCHRLSVSDTDSVLAVPPPELSGSGRCHRLSVSDTDSVLAVPPPELSGSGRCHRLSVSDTDSVLAVPPPELSGSGRCHRLSVSDTDSVLAVPPPELSGSGRCHRLSVSDTDSVLAVPPPELSVCKSQDFLCTQTFIYCIRFMKSKQQHTKSEAVRRKFTSSQEFTSQKRSTVTAQLTPKPSLLVAPLAGLQKLLQHLVIQILELDHLLLRARTSSPRGGRRRR